MLKHKIAGVLLSLALVCAGIGVLLFDGANASAAPKTPSASLFLPETYEQYLALENPVSFDISEDYTVVADGHTLYIYDRAKGVYSQYEHMSYMQTSDFADISMVQIAEIVGANNDRIFFSDSDLHLYEYKAGETVTSREMIINNVSAQSFLVDEVHDSLFTANSATGSNDITLTRYSLSDLQNADLTSRGSYSLKNASSPLLTVDGDTLYLIYNNRNIRTCQAMNLSEGQNTETLTSDLPIDGLQAIAYYGGKLYYSVKSPSANASNGLYRYGDGKLDLGRDTSAGISALTVYRDKFYCLMGKSVYLLNVDEAGDVTFGDYEIASSSASVGRLSGAKDVVRAGNLLVTADSENSRIDVYNISSGTHAVISVGYSPALVATDGKIVAAAAENSIYEYTCDIDGHWSQGQTYSLDSGEKVNGIACVFGKVYYTSSAHRGVLGGEPVFATSPKGLAANLYGDLFVVNSDNTVKRFTEETFIQNGDDEDTTITLPNEFHSLRADFEGNLYYLDKDGALFCNGETESLATKIDATKYVYTETDLSPVSFALGYEDDEVYFLFGDFIVKTDAGALGFPSLGTIPANGVREMVFTPHPLSDISFREVKKNSVGIRVDLGTLSESASFFPYSSYARADEAGKDVPLRGVLLAKTGKYALLALYENREYSVQLFREEDCVSAEPNIQEGENAEKYLSSDAFVYYFPCITAAHAERLPRGATVKVISVVQSDADKADGVDLGLDFAYVEYETNARATMRGYLPLSFLTSANPNGEAREKYFLGDILPQGEGVVFTADDGSTVTLTERTQVSLFDNGDGTYFARYERDGIVYTATVSHSIVDKGESDALRISLIIILSVLAVVIVGAYIYLLPRGKKKKI